MRAGRLRHRVTIQEKTVTQDTFGAEVITWSDVITLWAGVEPLRGREFDELRRTGAEVTTRIVTRYKSGVLPEMRATYNSHTYDILSVINLEERDREVHLMCREVL